MESVDSTAGIKNVSWECQQNQQWRVPTRWINVGKINGDNWKELPQKWKTPVEVFVFAAKFLKLEIFQKTKKRFHTSFFNCSKSWYDLKNSKNASVLKSSLEYGKNFKINISFSNLEENFFILTHSFWLGFVLENYIFHLSECFLYSLA